MAYYLLNQRLIFFINQPSGDTGRQSRLPKSRQNGDKASGQPGERQPILRRLFFAGPGVIMRFLMFLLSICSARNQGRFSFTFSLLILLSIFFPLPQNAQAAQATLTWNPNSEPDLLGYIVHYGTVSGNYQVKMDVGNNTQASVSNLQDGGTYYFAVTAYDSSGNDSVYSNEVVYSATAIPACSLSISPASQSFTSSGGSGNVSVATSSGCPWTSLSNHSWIVITSNAKTTGSGTTYFSVSPNTNGSTRTGTLSIAGKVFTVSQSGASGEIAFALNAGGQVYTDKAGVRYSADTYYQSGRTWKTDSSIAETEDDELHKSSRYGNFSYAVPIPNGNYVVTLKFAEIYWSSANRRIFNVKVGGQEVIRNLDLFAKVGKNRAYDVTIPVSVNDRVLRIEFVPIKDNAKISAILVRKAQ